MEIEFSQMLVLFACVFLGGLVDSIAGGGAFVHGNVLLYLY